MVNLERFQHNILKERTTTKRSSPFEAMVEWTPAAKILASPVHEGEAKDKLQRKTVMQKSPKCGPKAMK